MSDTNGQQGETREVTFEEALVNRMAQRIGMLSAQLDMAQLNLEIKDQEIAKLNDQLREATLLAMEMQHDAPVDGAAAIPDYEESPSPS